MQSLFFIAAFFVAVAVLPAHSAQPINSIVAVVNDAPITRVEVDLEINRIIKESATPDIAPAILRRQALDFLIDRQLLLQQAALSGASVPPQMLEDRIADIRRQWEVSDEQLQTIVRQEYGLSPQKFRERVHDDILTQAVFYRQVYSRIEISDDEVERFLLAEMASAREYRLQHILIASGEGARELAQSLREKIVSGDSFGALAKKHSSGERAADGGDLGFRLAGDLPAVFIAEAQNLSDGETSEVLTTGRGFHLLKLLAKKGGELRDTAERVNIAHLFMSPDDSETIEKVYQKIKNGDSFAGAVREYSIDRRSIEKDGDLGWFAVQALPDYFVKPAASLAPGEVSAPIKSPFGWHLLRLRERQTKTIDLTKMRKKAGEVLREQRAAEERKIWLRRLRGLSYIAVLDADFSADEQ